jgi:hypothetical protein
MVRAAVERGYDHAVRASNERRGKRERARFSPGGAAAGVWRAQIWLRGPLSDKAVFRPLPEYDEVVEKARIFLSRLGDHGAVLISVATLIALSIYPIPFCIDCEFPNPWGHAAVWAEVPVSVWLLIAPFMAGLFALRRGWLVPISVVFALLVTQPVGGVAWWSLTDNEGPFILILGLPVTLTCFGIGYMIRKIVFFTKAMIASHAR